jgi:hypothetical protein
MRTSNADSKLISNYGVFIWEVVKGARDDFP